MTSTTVDVAIVGGGLMGCFSAYFLRQQHGRSVAVIEKAKVCAAASAVNFGNLRLQGRNPLEFPLSLRAHTIWEDLARLTGEDCGVVQCGHVYLGFAPGDKPKLEQAARDARAAGLDVDLLDAMARLVRLLDAPADASALLPLITREIIYRLLVGERMWLIMLRFAIAAGFLLLGYATLRSK
jgi:glycine/D-amino acid oxidase-like deaminating enzyme